MSALKSRRKQNPLQPKQLNYDEMTQKFGHIMALDILMCVEKMARLTIDDTRKTMDKQQRLASALAELDKLNGIGKLKPANKTDAPSPSSPRDEALF